jgi:hypothetical protein
MVEYIYDAQSQDRRGRLCPVTWTGVGHGHSWNSELSEHFVQCFESDGFDQAKVFLMSAHTCEIQALGSYALSIHAGFKSSALVF